MVRSYQLDNSDGHHERSKRRGNIVNRQSSNTFYFNSEREDWLKGRRQLQQKRTHRSRGRILERKRFSVIVAADWEGRHLSSVEILDEGATEWRRGHELPAGLDHAQLGLNIDHSQMDLNIDHAQMVEDQNAGIVLIL